eukprot:772302-Amphidinium_carterae.1
MLCPRTTRVPLAKHIDIAHVLTLIAGRNDQDTFDGTSLALANNADCGWALSKSAPSVWKPRPRSMCKTNAGGSSTTRVLCPRSSMCKASSSNSTPTPKAGLNFNLFLPAK